MTRKLRLSMLMALMLPALLLVGCGGTSTTPTSTAPAGTATTSTSAGTTPTEMAAGTPSEAAGSTPSEAAAMTPSEAAGMTPSAEAATTPSAETGMTPSAGAGTASAAGSPSAQGTGTAGTSSGPTAAGATPVADWTPGAYAGSIKAPAKLVAAGTLTIGSDASYPPQEYIGQDGKAVGLDIDIANEIASRLGLKLNVVNFKFDNLLPALNAGQFDLVVSAMTITDDRKKVVDFVPYFDAGQAVLVKKGNPLGIKKLEDLSGHTAVAEQGTVEETTLKTLNDQLTKAGKPTVNILTYPTDTDAVDQLRIGRADATLHDSPVAAYYAKLYPDFEVAIPNFESAPEGIAVAKGNSDMLNAVTQALDAMKKDGTLDKIKAKWGVQ